MHLPDKQDRPFIAVVIPSLRGDVDYLLEALKKQTWQPDQIQVIRHIQRNGSARNQGVACVFGEAATRKKQDDTLVFIDDDALPAQERLIEMLVAPLMSDPGIGVTGAARVLPPGSPWFQRRIAKEIPRLVNEVPSVPLETNPPLRGYGHSLITTTCCAVRFTTYLQSGGFSEELVSGVDTDFFYRVRQLGFRFVLVPDVFVYHPVPVGLWALMKKFHWYGIGYAQEAKHRPQQHIGPLLPTALHRSLFLLAASLWLLPNSFILYSYSYPRFRLGFRPLKALSTYAVAWGYAQGWRQEATSSI